MLQGQVVKGVTVTMSPTLLILAGQHIGLVHWQQLPGQLAIILLHCQPALAREIVPAGMGRLGWERLLGKVSRRSRHELRVRGTWWAHNPLNLPFTALPFHHTQPVKGPMGHLSGELSPDIPLKMGHIGWKERACGN